MHRDSKSIERLIASFEEAWRRRDADGFAATFAEDCTYVAVDGDVYHGRNQVADVHRALWTPGFGVVRIFQEILSIHFPGDNIAIVIARGEFSKRQSRPWRLGKILAYVATRHPDGWLFDHFQNTDGSGVIGRVAAFLGRDPRGPTGTGILMP